MQALQNKIAIQINPKVFKKDPLSSELGEKILRNGIELMEEIGFEDFTFRKLAKYIQSTEASIYRHFENKHNLLAYLTMWYWSWMEYQIVLSTLNIEDPEIRLRKSIKCLTEEVKEDLGVKQINEAKLNRIIIVESSKVYLCKKVNQDNSMGFFMTYKSLVQRISDVIMEINPTFKYPHMLVSTVIEGTHHQRFFADNLPALTDVKKGEDAISIFYEHLVLSTIK
jgi:AcrR family transcriptional regulator